MISNPFFHFFEENRDFSLKYVFGRNPNRVKKYLLAELVPLPSPEKISSPLSALIQQRQSQTVATKKSIDLKKLSTVLYWSAAEIGMRTVNDGEREYKKVQKPHPSGGACYPLEIYICLDQEGFKLGLYHYRPDIHGIELVKELDQKTMNIFKETLLRNTHEITEVTAPAILMFSYIQERNIFKYGSLGMKLALIEGGHVAQNVYLTATALNLSCCAIGSFETEAAHKLLEIDGYNENLFYALTLGY